MNDVTIDEFPAPSLLASGPAVPIRVLVVDDHPVVRMGLSTMLNLHEDIVVVDALPDGPTLIDRLASTDDAIDVVLLDLRMPGLSGVETLRKLRTVAPAVRTLVLSSFEFDEEIHQTIEAGACGYLLKEVAGDEIVDAVRAVHAGRLAFPRRIADRIASRKLTAGLSPREREILGLVAKGLTNKEIASALQLSQFTVRNHLNHITSKLDASDRTEAAYIALYTGILTLS